VDTGTGEAGVNAGTGDELLILMWMQVQVMSC